MTEKSAFFNGVVDGDAINAPYTSAYFAQILKSAYATSGAVVLPEQLNNLAVIAAAGRTVSILAGRAVIEGYWYENSAAVSLTLDQNTSAYGRFDRIAVEIDTATDICTIVAIRGVPSSAPAIPALPVCSTKYYMTLARIYLPAAYVATSSYYIFDERVFANNAYHINTYNVQNTFPNGRFLVFGDSENTGVNRNPMPGGWVRYNTGSALKSLDRFDNMPAGRVVNSYLGAANDGWSYIILTSENYTGRFTLRLLVETTQGECAINFAGVALRVPVSSSVQEIIIRVSTTGYQSMDIYHQTGSDIFSFSDIRFTHGWVVPPPATYGNYIVMFDSPVQAKRTGAPTLTGLSTGTTDIVFSDDFGSDDDNVGVIVAGRDAAEIKSLIMLLGTNDSGSAGNYVWSALVPVASPSYLRVDLEGVANDSPRYRTGLTAIDNEILNAVGMTGMPAVNGIYVLASGAGTADLYVAVIGAIL